MGDHGSGWPSTVLGCDVLKDVATRMSSARFAMGKTQMAPALIRGRNKGGQSFEGSSR